MRHMGDNPRKCGLSNSRRSPENHRRNHILLNHLPKHLPLSNQMLLTHIVIQCFRAQAACQRTPHIHLFLKQGHLSQSHLFHSFCLTSHYGQNFHSDAYILPSLYLIPYRHTYVARFHLSLIIPQLPGIQFIKSLLRSLEFTPLNRCPV